MCHANMKFAYHLGAAVAVTAVTLATPAAQAGDTPLFGVSVDGYAAPTWDHSITDQQSGRHRQATRSMVGVATLFNVDEIAFGGVVDGMPALMGDGRLSLGAMLGWQPRVGSHRYQLLGELGAERFSDVGGTLVGTPSTNETWLDYVGARLGMSESFGSDGPFELGAWLFVRKDLGEANVASTTGSFMPGSGDANTQYLLGGYSAGVALRIGLRFEQKRAASESTVEVEYEPAKS